MKKIVLVTAFALSQLLAASAFSQTTRAAVKADAASAVKSGDTPKGEITAAPKPKSTAARADVKKEAAAAEKSGAIPAGEAGTKESKPMTVKQRADVKAETKQAEKKGEIKAGEK